MKLLTGILSLLFLVTSCIGTIEDTKKVDKSTIKKNVKFSFSGIVDCYAVSDKKVEVSFDPAYILSGTAKLDELVYKVFLNGNFESAVSSMMARDLRVNTSGRFFLEVENLSINTNYTVSVRVHDPSSGNTDNNTASCVVKTKDEKLPIFSGLTEVAPFPGIEGQTSVLLKWTTAKAAEYLLGGIPASGFRISKYNLYAGTDSDDPQDLTLLTTLNESSSAPVTQYQVSGLLQGQKYFYMIRAVDESGREDQNRKVLSARTSTPQSLNFSGISSLTVPTNSSGYTSLRATWTSPLGNFNRFRIFAIPETEAMYSSTIIDPADTTFMVGEISNTTAVSSQVVGLTPNTNYAVFVVACMFESGSCVAKAGDQKKLIAKTQPPLAPFAGISTIAPLDGVLGLNQVKLNWSAPAITAGVCSGIKIFQNDVAVKECGDPTLGVGEACLSSLSVGCSSTSVVVANLTTDQEYCFTSTVFEGARQQPSPLVKKCITTRFDPPIFQTPHVCTALDGGTKVKIDWVKPSPEGLFTNYLIIAKKDPGTTVNPSTFLNSAKAIFEGSSTDSNLPLSERYRFFTKAKGTLTHTISGLSPDTTYNFMVKTHMSNSGTHYYDQGTTIVSCKTSPLSMNFGGWEHVLSIGPRIAGYADHRTGPSSEQLSANLTANATDLVQIPARGIEYETLMTSDGVTHPKVVKVDMLDKSNSGIVQLMWHELKTSDGLKITDFLFNEGVTLNPGVDGYFLYRKVTPSFSNDAEYESILNQIQGSNSGWELVNPGAPISLVNGIGSYTDYIPSSIHPIHGAGGNFRQKANTGKVVWYTVRFRLNGALARYTENVNKDAIIAVIIPPANMASIHHWMANKKICEIYKKDVERNNNYRCQFGGMGAKEIDNNSYFDVEGHTLIDRWTLGCNFSRFDEVDKACYNSNSSTLLLDHNTQGVYSGTRNSSWAYRDGELANKSGDCAGIQFLASRQYYPNAPKGSVYYNNNDMSCYYRVGELLSNPTTPNHTLHWRKIGDTNFEPTSPKSATTLLPGALPNEFLGRIYPTNIDPLNGLGVGAVMSSNDSSLPPMVNVTQDQAHFLCQSHAIQIQSGTNSSPYIRKRNIAGHEQMTASLPHPTVTDTQRKKLEISMINTITTGTGTAGLFLGKRDTVGASTNGGGCSTLDIYMSNFYDLDSYRNILTKAVSVGNTFQSLPVLWLTGSYDVAGLLDNKFNGTERCVSGFGVQDYIGNHDYWFNEKLLCRANSSGSNADCDISPTQNTISDYNLSTGDIWPTTRYNPSQETYYGQEYFKNGYNNYFSTKYYVDQDYSGSFGFPYTRKTGLFNSISNYTYPRIHAAGFYYTMAGLIHYPLKQAAFSFVTGTAVNCQSGLCHPDDDFNVNSSILPSNLNTFKDGYFPVNYNTANLVANSFFLQGRRRDTTKPESGSYNYQTNNVDQVQFFQMNDGTNDRVSYEKIMHPFTSRWQADNVGSSSTAVRCSVKVTLNPFGNVIKVDDQEQE